MHDARENVYQNRRSVILCGVKSRAKALPGAREKAIAAYLDDARRDAGLSQQALADVLGVDQGQVSRLLRGVRPMTLPEMLSICDLLGVSPSQVMHRAGQS